MGFVVSHTPEVLTLLVLPVATPGATHVPGVIFVDEAPSILAKPPFSAWQPGAADMIASRALEIGAVEKVSESPQGREDGRDSDVIMGAADELPSEEQVAAQEEARKKEIATSAVVQVQRGAQPSDGLPSTPLRQPNRSSFQLLRDSENGDLRHPALLRANLPLNVITPHAKSSTAKTNLPVVEIVEMISSKMEGWGAGTTADAMLEAWADTVAWHSGGKAHDDY